VGEFRALPETAYCFAISSDPILKYGDKHHATPGGDWAGDSPWLSQMKENLMLLWIAIIIAVLWLLGLLANIGGGLIHILLVVAVVVLIFHFLQGRRRV
jgi:fatty acid desaturase